MPQPSQAACRVHTNKNCSCPRAPTAQAWRARLRPDPPAVPRADMPRNFALESRGGRVRGPQDVHLRPRLRRGGGPGGRLRLRGRQRQLVRAGLQRLHPGVRPVRRGQVVHDGHHGAERARRRQDHGHHPSRRRHALREAGRRAQQPGCGVRHSCALPRVWHRNAELRGQGLGQQELAAQGDLCRGKKGLLSHYDTQC
jgi:hypothetical protein